MRRNMIQTDLTRGEEWPCYPFLRLQGTVWDNGEASALDMR